MFISSRTPKEEVCASISAGPDDNDDMIRNQLLNVYYDPSHAFSFHLSAVHTHWIRWMTEEAVEHDTSSSSSCHRITVFAKSERGGLTRTHWEHQRLFDVHGRSVVTHHADDRYPPHTWTKIKADLHHLDELVSVTVYHRRVQIQGQLAHPWTDDDFDALFERCLPHGTRHLSPPRVALIVFHGTTGLSSLARIDAPSVCAQTTNPHLAIPNTQRIVRDHRDRPFLHIYPGARTPCWRSEIRVGCTSLFHITYTSPTSPRTSSSRLPDPNEPDHPHPHPTTDRLTHIWADASELAAHVTDYLTDHLRNGTLVVVHPTTPADEASLATTASSYHKNNKNNALRRLPKLEGRAYREYTSAELRDLYHARRASSPPTPPQGFVWQRKSKKLYLFLCLVGMIPLDHAPDLLDDFVRPSTQQA